MTEAADPTSSNSRPEDAERVAKAIARAGVCSRREAETLVNQGRVTVNGKTLDSPAFNVRAGDDVRVDGEALPRREPPRLWRYHKPAGLVTTHNDPEGRATVFDQFTDLPRVLSVGRLDLNTEGLLLLTNDGGLARHLELPSTGWKRRYRVRAHGHVEPRELEAIRDGVEVDGVRYGAVEAAIDRRQGGNVWLTIAIKEGKNREVRRILEHLGLKTNRLIRTAYGPFQLGSLKRGEVAETPAKTLREQLGEKISQQIGLKAHANRRRRT